MLAFVLMIHHHYSNLDLNYAILHLVMSCKLSYEVTARDTIRVAWECSLSHVFLLIIFDILVTADRCTIRSVYEMSYIH